MESKPEWEPITALREQSSMEIEDAEVSQGLEYPGSYSPLPGYGESQAHARATITGSRLDRDSRLNQSIHEDTLEAQEGGESIAWVRC